MCGFVGKYYFKKSAYDSSDITTMMQSIFHRGPDDDGQYQDDRIILGFRRLSIIDTIHGGQPLFNETKKIVLIANGEIYNYKELRNDLKLRGHKFRTNSDCEVILHMYEEFGNNFLPQLNGMFAFCLYDSEQEYMLIGRDRIGIKPLYYSCNENVVVFASEIKGILAANEIKPEENSECFAEYLCFRSLSNENTFFKNIYALSPGSCIELKPELKNSFTYWSPNLAFEKHIKPEEIINAIESSVKRQMMSDVPLGTQLSGGVDSSFVSAIASTFQPDIKAFTVGFHESEYDESESAKLLTNHFNIDYREIRVDSKQFADILPKAIWFHDEPLCHANSVHIYLLCKFASQYIKVLLTGEGADELFGGYPRYYIFKIANNYLKFPSVIRESITHLLKKINTRRIQKLSSSLGLNSYDLILWNAQFVTWDKASWLIGDNHQNISKRKSDLNLFWRERISDLDKLLLFDQKTYLQPILMRQDKMSMAASVESRVPILDNEMINLANSIPASKKLKYFQTKRLFKKAAAQHIPPKIVYKKKVGFGVPIGNWLLPGNGMNHYLDMLLDSTEKLPFRNPPKLEKIVSEHTSQIKNHEDILWPLVNYAVWKETFLN